MPYIDPKIVSEIKQIDLLSYLSAYERNELVALGGGVYSLRSHDSIKLSNGMWHQFSRGQGGKSALDYFIKVEGLSFQDAVIKIADAVGIAVCGTQNKTAKGYIKHKPPTKTQKKLSLPSKCSDSSRVMRYLKERRYIAPVIIEMFTRRGAIYESEYKDSASGKIYVNAVFLGMGSDGAPRQASIRGLYTDFKGEAPGSDKHYSFAHMAEGSSEVIHIFESAIDLMSYLTIEERYGQRSFSENYISLSGVYRPKADSSGWKIPSAIERVLEDNNGIKIAKIHFDNDEAGRLAQRALTKALQESFVHAIDEPPRFGKDYNDYLRFLARRELEPR